ncbi:hypothetical protein FHR81_004721 [Actinoalloteichus hoggarensis]|uniref:Uncharacterized protein n=1 Tax=Actinoalloteichus hoggarensis TaxID=1470176 RepID=A0A221W4U5_9PSEU|nr:hypothetical protein [Actinoalloteichus hoggarensis]ASO20609.1 hypothetical protein AHOG_14840 [Actinoalloteichus hoggarensis]MBB5923650.1 hypothetical protein [Actinoalloteichus hoggarensis]
MNDLRKLITLHARWYEFLERQDDATLAALVGGTARLAIVPGDDADADTPRAAAAVDPDPAPPTPRLLDPLQTAVHTLQTADSVEDRRGYLAALGFSVPDLRTVAKRCGLRGYSRLPRPELLEFLARGGAEPTPAATGLGRPAAADAGGATAEKGSRSSMTPTSDTSRPSDTSRSADAAAVAARLRQTETEEEGAAYLEAQDLDRDGLLAVAAELRLTRVARLSRPELRRRVLKQAIGARRKFAGLRKW